jgi:hypothetical protein
MTMGLLGWKVMVVLAGLAGVVSTDHAFDRHAVTDQQPRPVMVRVDDEIAAEDCTHFHTRLEVSVQFAEKFRVQVTGSRYKLKDVPSGGRQNVNFPVEYFRFIRSTQ